MPGSADEGPLQPDSTAAAPAWWCSDAGATTRRTGLAGQGSADFSQSQHGYRSYPGGAQTLAGSLGIHRERFGRGARRARTVMGADYVICFLEDIYTPVERTLIDAGRFEAVQATRNAFQDTMRQTFSEAVEELTGREVIGFLSQVHVDPDLAVETFILKSADGD